MEVNPPDILSVRTRTVRHRSPLPHRFPAGRAALLLQPSAGKACPGLMRIISRRAVLSGFGSLCTGRITGIHGTRTMAEFSRDQVVFNKPKVGSQRRAVQELPDAATFPSGFKAIWTKYDEIQSPEASSAAYSTGFSPAVTLHNYHPVMDGCVLLPRFYRFCTAGRKKMPL